MDKQNFAPIKQRILQVIEFKQDTKKKIFDLLEVSKSNFSGKGLYSEVGGEVIAKFLTIYPEINPEWLLTGNGPMLKEQKQGDGNTNVGHHNKIATHESKIIEAPSGSDQERIQFLEEQVKFYREQAEFYREKAHHLDYTNRQATDKQPISNE